MPIIVDSEIHVFSEDEFHELARKIIGIAFDVHNDFGRLMDEEIYKQTIRRRCEAAGVVPARREVEVKVSHEDFEKPYFIDLLFAHGLMVETKTVEQLSNAHHAQSLHYLMLTGMRHALLLNMRSARVEKRFVSTTLNLQERRRYLVRDAKWNPQNEASQRLQRIVLALLNDWGSFLQTALYREAVIHFFGGPDQALRKVPIFDGDSQVGTHEVCLLSDDTMLAMTSLKSAKEAMGNHLQRFLGHTKLTCLQWVNIDGHEVEFQTFIQ